MALVSGEPGIGKSRLLLEFSSELSAQGYSVSTIFCSRRGSLSPLQPFGEVMGDVPATPQEAAAWVEEQAHGAPVMFVVEDAHWADPSTLEAVHLIARGTARVLVLMSARPEIADDPHVQPDDQLTLDRLSAYEARQMLERLPETAQLKPDVRSALVQRADGVPLFLEELARGLTDGSEVAGSALPTTLAEVITARLDRVGDAKHVAQAAAVIGRSFDRPMLVAATGLDGREPRRRYSAVCRSTPSSNRRRGPVRCSSAMRCSTRRRTDPVLRPDRARVHGAVGEMLVASGRAEAQPEIAAYHLGAAGRATEAVPLWKRASHTARQNARFREAAAHEREVLALVPQLPEDEREQTELRSRSRLVMCLTAVDQSAPEALEESQRVEELASPPGRPRDAAAQLHGARPVVAGQCRVFGHQQGPGRGEDRGGSPG